MYHQNIALLGLAGSGKSTLAKSLEESHTVLSFAAPVKELSIVLYNTMAEELGREAMKLRSMEDMEGSKTYFRKLIQIAGDELGRGYFGESIWVDKMSRILDYYEENNSPVIIDDVRYPNELNMLISRGFKIVYVDRAGLKRMEHPSESLTYELAQDICEVWAKGLTYMPNKGTKEQFTTNFKKMMTIT